jgi:hypothetical protein
VSRHNASFIGANVNSFDNSPSITHWSHFFFTRPVQHEVVLGSELEYDEYRRCRSLFVYSKIEPVCKFKPRLYAVACGRVALGSRFASLGYGWSFSGGMSFRNATGLVQTRHIHVGRTAYLTPRRASKESHGFRLSSTPLEREESL